VKELLRSRRFQAAVSIVLGIGLLAYFLSRVPLGDIGRQIARASPSWLLASIVVSLSIFVARALRWTWILRPLGRVPFLPAFRTTSIGFAANTVLPARAGEVIRPALLARERGLPFSALLASIVFERILDALAQLAFLGIALFTGVAGESGALSSGRIRWVVAAIAAVAVGIALFAVSGGRPPNACWSGSSASCPNSSGSPRCGSLIRSWTDSPRSRSRGSRCW
jgi:uncharacterized protein (TIRG00374 family)